MPQPARRIFDDRNLSREGNRRDDADQHGKQGEVYDVLCCVVFALWCLSSSSSLYFEVSSLAGPLASHSSGVACISYFKRVSSALVIRYA